MKTGLALEGGAMRGLFSAGALDFFLEERRLWWRRKNFFPWGVWKKIRRN